MSVVLYLTFVPVLVEIGHVNLEKKAYRQTDGQTVDDGRPGKLKSSKLRWAKYRTFPSEYIYIHR